MKELAQDLKKATNIRIADVTHNAIRRNIALNHELNSMLQICQDLEMENTECKDNDRMLRLQCELSDAGAKIALDNMIKQRHTMHELAQNYVDMVLEYGRTQRENARFKNYQKLIDEYKEKCVATEEQVRMLEKRLEKTKRARETLLAEVRDKCKKYRRLSKILNEAKRCVLEALEVPPYRFSLRKYYLKF